MCIYLVFVIEIFYFLGFCKDKMYLYAREILYNLSLCLLWRGFHDAVSEGD